MVQSTVLTVSYSEFRSSIQLGPDRDIIILPETYLPVLPRYAPGLPKLVFNQNGALVGLKSGDGFPDPEVLNYMLILN